MDVASGVGWTNRGARLRLRRRPPAGDRRPGDVRRSTGAIRAPSSAWQSHRGLDHCRTSGVRPGGRPVSPGSRRGMAAWAGLVVVMAAVSIPMLVGLREPDLASDEAIYSYAVERMVDT